jgi:hypothetical protein
MHDIVVRRLRASGATTLLFDFPDITPGASVSIPFDGGAAAGLYRLVWHASAPVGFANFGVFRLSAEWWSGDPLNGGVFVDNAADISQLFNGRAD